MVLEDFIMGFWQVFWGYFCIEDFILDFMMQLNLLPLKKENIQDSLKIGLLLKSQLLVQDFQKIFKVILVSETISYPTDTIKRKMMMKSGRNFVLFTGTMDCIVKIY